ncbi:hypothetical protein ACFFRR_009671 [Megaselia abdita]
MSMTMIKLILLFLANLVSSWDLSATGINEFKLLHAELYLVRVFLSVKPLNNNTTTETATLIESTWPENYFSLLPKIFPDKALHALTVSEKKNCFLIQQVIQTEIDNLYRLWVIDEGNEHCEPKILLYDLLRGNMEVARLKCKILIGKKIISIKLDPNTACHSKYKIYITVENEDTIYVYNLHSDLWETLKIKAIDDEISGLLIPVNPTHIVFIGAENIGQFYVSDSEGSLFFGNFQRSTNVTTDSLVIRKLGSLLGVPKSLILDPMGMVYYVVQKFGIVVRWIPYKGRLKAEEHEVLYFSITEIELTQVIFGSMGSVWVVKSNVYVNKDHCDRILYHYMLQSNTSEVI